MPEIKVCDKYASRENAPTQASWGREGDVYVMRSPREKVERGKGTQQTGVLYFIAGLCLHDDGSGLEKYLKEGHGIKLITMPASAFLSPKFYSETKQKCSNPRFAASIQKRHFRGDAIFVSVTAVQRLIQEDKLKFELSDEYKKDIEKACDYLKFAEVKPFQGMIKAFKEAVLEGEAFVEVQQDTIYLRTGTAKDLEERESIQVTAEPTAEGRYVALTKTWGILNEDDGSGKVLFHDQKSKKDIVMFRRSKFEKDAIAKLDF